LLHAAPVSRDYSASTPARKRRLPAYARGDIEEANDPKDQTLLARLIASICVFVTLAYAAAAEDRPVIAAASDLQFALPEIVEAFTAQTGSGVRLIFGSTGNFARQIREGAPFEMFMAADEVYVQTLAADGFTQGEGALYGLGRLVLIRPIGWSSGQSSDAPFAIANPEHAPYGQRAREVLQNLHLWEVLQPHLVLGENVSQAAQFALSGSTQGGLIAYSLALSDAISSRGDFELIPAELHTPLRQRMVLLNGAGETAQAFYAYMNTPAARKIMRRYGFVLPGE